MRTDEHADRERLRARILDARGPVQVAAARESWTAWMHAHPSDLAIRRAGDYLANMEDALDALANGAAGREPVERTTSAA